MLFFLPLAEAAPEAEKAFLNLTLHWSAVSGAVGASILALAAAVKWIWDTIAKWNIAHDEDRDKAVQDKEKAMREHFRPVVAGLQKERDNALEAETSAKKSLDEIREEMWRESLPVIKRTDAALTEFAGILGADLDQIASVIKTNGDRWDDLKPLLKTLQKTLKNATQRIQQGGSSDA